MMTATDAPRVWVGCLGCYNAGHLAGEWFDAADAPTDEPAWRNEVTAPGVLLPAAHYAKAHEELWVFDYEGFGGLLAGECSPAEAQRIAELIADLNEDEREGFAAYVADTGLTADAESLDSFRDDYQGVWDSREDFAQNLAEELGAVPREHSWPASYIDWESAARDLFMDYSDAPAFGGRIHVWRRS